MKRPVVIIGNWKMHKTIGESLAFVKHLAPKVEKSSTVIGLAVPFTALHATAKLVKELKANIKVGAQNMNDNPSGAFTGEVSVSMLQEAGADFVILGHSERRHLFHESNAMINQKVTLALEAGLLPILCVGEKLEERDQKETVLKEQLYGSLEGLTTAQVKQLMLAYEPVWAIGTGVVAHPDDAEAAHRHLRELLAKKWGKEIAASMVIQYGGSVKPENSADLLAKEDVDGLLVGGASLSADSFSEIINQG